MANRNLRGVYSQDTDTVHLYAKVELAAAGAIESFSGAGIASVAKGGTGVFDVTLQDAYFDLKSVNVQLLSSTAKDFSFQLEAEAVKASKTLSFFTNIAGTETDPADGDILLVEIIVKKSSVAV